MALIPITPYYNFTASLTAVNFRMPAYAGPGIPYLIGSRYGDKLYGSKGRDEINGWYGDDLIYGDGGGDILSGGEGRDRIFGGDDSDLIFGGNGDDTLYGDNGQDAIMGDAGSDRIFGGSDNDILNGNNGSDIISGDDGNDRLDGGADDDTLNGGTGDDVLLGGDGWDVLNGGAHSDYLSGGTGYNTLEGGADNDVFAGGAGIDDIRGDDAPPASAPWMAVNGIDSVRYLDSPTGVGVTLRANAYWTSVYDTATQQIYWYYIVEGTGDGWAGDAQGDTFYSIENVEGSRFDDTILGNSFDNTFYGFDGNDRLEGGDGADVLLGGYGDDIIKGGNGNDVIYGGGVLTRTATLPNNFVWPAWNQPIAPVIVDVMDYDAREWWHDSGNDYLEGGEGDDDIYGSGGNDTLVGGNGANRMFGGDGDDMIVAGRDAEIIDGDVRYENFAASELKGGPGSWSQFHADIFGNDTVDYSRGETGVRIVFTLRLAELNFTQDNANGTATSYIPLYMTQVATGIGGNAQGDELYAIENVIGSGGDDYIVGTNLFDNRFQGNSGNDYLDGGGGGKDTFIGNAGYDLSVGGSGIDTFIYLGVNDAKPSFTYLGGAIPQGAIVETIRSFTSGQDVIDLAAVDAIESSWQVNDAFTLVGGFSGVAGELMVDAFAGNAAGGYVYAVAGDTNGDKVADFLIQVETTAGAKLQPIDFIL